MQKVPENPYQKTNRYAKLVEGANRYRFFNYIDGWEFWEEKEGKKTPVRNADLTKFPKEKAETAKFFRAFVVWDYTTGSTKILNLTQRSILEPLTTLFYDTDWGNAMSLSDFDIVITRKGEGMETEYNVTPKPKTKFEGALDMVDLKALYENGDPFNPIGNVSLDDLEFK